MLFLLGNLAINVFKSAGVNIINDYFIKFWFQQAYDDDRLMKQCYFVCTLNLKAHHNILNLNWTKPTKKNDNQNSFWWSDRNFFNALSSCGCYALLININILLLP